MKDAMPKYRTITFAIKDFTPTTLPMARLAEYLADYAKLLGNEGAVHFERVKAGSAELVGRADEIEYPAVRKRVWDASRGLGPEEAVRAYQNLNAKLKQDKTSAQWKGGAKILQFPGIQAQEPTVFGPFNQVGTLDGILVKIGGTDKTIPVHIEEPGRPPYICNANSRDLARRLAPHLFGDPIRLHGTGRWVREADGNWKLIGFNIADFEELNNDSLPVIVERLRAIPGDGWASVDDPLGELRRIRTGKAQ